MAHIITDAEAQSLVRIADSIIGPLVSQGIIGKNDMPDAVQDLLAEVVRLAGNYDEKKETGFLTYAYGVMEVQVFRIIRKLYSRTNRMLAAAVSVEDILEVEDSDEAPDYHRLGIKSRALAAGDWDSDNRELYASVREVVGTLPEEQRKICRLLMDGYGISDIVRILNVSRKSVRTRIAAIRTAFIKAGLSPQK